MGKLKNIKAINEMLRGQHRSQTKATTGFENKKTERVIGEVWTDDNGQKWVQKDGYKSKVSRFDKIRKLITADKCPCCNKKITNFDKQFIKRENKLFILRIQIYFKHFKTFCVYICNKDTKISINKKFNK